MSTIKAQTWLNTDGTENYKCRAWVNFNGTGTITIVASKNISGLVDLGTGTYQVNISTSMADSNYIYFTACRSTVDGVPVAFNPYSGFGTQSASYFLIRCAFVSTGAADMEKVYAAVFYT